MGSIHIKMKRKMASLNSEDSSESEAESMDSDEELQEAFSKGELGDGLNVNIPITRTYANNTAGMKSKLEESLLKLEWVERLDLTTHLETIADNVLVGKEKIEPQYKVETPGDQIVDDLLRETLFYRQAQIGRSHVEGEATSTGSTAVSREIAEGEEVEGAEEVRKEGASRSGSATGQGEEGDALQSQTVQRRQTGVARLPRREDGQEERLPRRNQTEDEREECRPPNHQDEQRQAETPGERQEIWIWRQEKRLQEEQSEKDGSQRR